MSEGRVEGQRRINSAILLVCDPAGRVQAVSAESADGLPAAGAATITEIFGQESHIGQWLAERIAAARDAWPASSKTLLDHDGQSITVRLDTLKRGAETYGFAVHILPGNADAGCPLSEGDAIVTRQQWHDIKNHMGGLKLYATLLKRRMAKGDDFDIVEKMLNGINAMIERVAKIRRGE